MTMNVSMRSIGESFAISCGDVRLHAICELSQSGAWSWRLSVDGSQGVFATGAAPSRNEAKAAVVTATKIVALAARHEPTSDIVKAVPSKVEDVLSIRRRVQDRKHTEHKKESRKALDKGADIAVSRGLRGRPNVRAQLYARLRAEGLSESEIAAKCGARAAHVRISLERFDARAKKPLSDRPV